MICCEKIDAAVDFNRIYEFVDDFFVLFFAFVFFLPYTSKTCFGVIPKQAFSTNSRSISKRLSQPFFAGTIFRLPVISMDVSLDYLAKIKSMLLTFVRMCNIMESIEEVLI